MGFWHTGYIEHHEWSGWGIPFDPSPRPIRCQKCGEVFDNEEAAREHRLEAHPFHRPALLVRGIEVGETRLHVRRRLKPEEIDFANAKTARINDADIPIDELPVSLSRRTEGVAIVDLANADVRARFSLAFDVPDADDLEGVDQALERMAERGRLDFRAIEGFIQEARSYRTARAYWDGVCHYFYGVLAKERSVESSLSYEKYSEKFNQASDCLGDNERVPARTIRALIAFHFNHFGSARDAGAGSRVGAVGGRYASWITGGNVRRPGLAGRVTAPAVDSFFADRETEEVLRLGAMSFDDLRHDGRKPGILTAADVPEPDRAKIHVLLAELNLDTGETRRAREHARELINKPGFEAWAGRILTPH